MKKRRITNLSVLMIFLSLLLFIDNGLTEFRHFNKQGSIQKTFEQDSLLKSAQEIEDHFKPLTRGGGEVEIAPPLELNVPFDFNSSELTKAAKIQLDELGKAMQSETLSRRLMKLAGYTDERGTADYNLRLSQRRVESAENYLIRNCDIQVNQLNAIGYGESQLIIKYAKTEAEHSVNRRVEIDIMEQWETDSNSGDQSGEDLNNSDELLSGPGNFEWGVFHIKDNNSQELIRPDGTSILKSNDKYRIYVKPPTRSYVYIYQEDSNGNGAWLFPKGKLKNPLYNNDNWIPSRDGSFSLDENTGTETIYLAASDKPVFNDPGSGSQDSSKVISFPIEMRGKEQRGVNIIEGNSEIDMDVIVIQNKNWEFYVEIKFKHK